MYGLWFLFVSSVDLPVPPTLPLQNIGPNEAIILTLICGACCLGMLVLGGAVAGVILYNRNKKKAPAAPVPAAPKPPVASAPATPSQPAGPAASEPPSAIPSSNIPSPLGEAPETQVSQSIPSASQAVTQRADAIPLPPAALEATPPDEPAPLSTATRRLDPEELLPPPAPEPPAGPTPDYQAVTRRVETFDLPIVPPPPASPAASEATTSEAAAPDEAVLRDLPEPPPDTTTPDYQAVTRRVDTFDLPEPPPPPGAATRRLEASELAGESPAAPRTPDTEWIPESEARSADAEGSATVRLSREELEAALKETEAAQSEAGAPESLESELGEGSEDAQNAATVIGVPPIQPPAAPPDIPPQVVCPACNGQYPESEAACPYCGRPNPNRA